MVMPSILLLSSVDESVSGSSLVKMILAQMFVSYLTFPPPLETTARNILLSPWDSDKCVSMRASGEVPHRPQLFRRFSVGGVTFTVLVLRREVLQ